MKAFLIVTQALALAAGEDTLPVPRPVTVELSNGSKIEGMLLEKDGAVTVLRVSGGEVRLADKNIRRVIEASPEAAPSVDGKSSGAHRVTIELPAPGAMSFEVPEAWTETKIEGRDLGLTDPTQSLFFGMSSANDGHSLWNLTAGIKKEYGKLYPGFVLGREKYLVKGAVRAWEMEFTYRKDSKDFREIQMLLDFGDTKRIFTFTAAAEKFGELVPRFRAVTDSFKFPTPEPAAEEADAAPVTGRQDRPPSPEKNGHASTPPSRQGDGPESDPELDLGPLLPIPEGSSRPCTDLGA